MVAVYVLELRCRVDRERRHRGVIRGALADEIRERRVPVNDVHVHTVRGAPERRRDETAAHESRRAPERLSKHMAS